MSNTFCMLSATVTEPVRTAASVERRGSPFHRYYVSAGGADPEAARAAGSAVRILAGPLDDLRDMPPTREPATDLRPWHEEYDEDRALDADRPDDAAADGTGGVRRGRWRSASAPAFGLILLGSLAGMMLLRHGGGSHISPPPRRHGRGGNFSALQADAAGGFTLLAGFCC